MTFFDDLLRLLLLDEEEDDDDEEEEEEEDRLRFFFFSCFFSPLPLSGDLQRSITGTTRRTRIYTENRTEDHVKRRVCRSSSHGRAEEKQQLALRRAVTEQRPRLCVTHRGGLDDRDQRCKRCR